MVHSQFGLQHNSTTLLGNTATIHAVTEATPITSRLLACTSSAAACGTDSQGMSQFDSLKQHVPKVHCNV